MSVLSSKDSKEDGKGDRAARGVSESSRASSDGGCTTAGMGGATMRMALTICQWQRP